MASTVASTLAGLHNRIRLVPALGIVAFSEPSSLGAHGSLPSDFGRRTNTLLDQNAAGPANA